MKNPLPLPRSPLAPRARVRLAAGIMCAAWGLVSPAVAAADGDQGCWALLGPPAIDYDATTVDASVYAEIAWYQCWYAWGYTGEGMAIVHLDGPAYGDHGVGWSESCGDNYCVDASVTLDRVGGTYYAEADAAFYSMYLGWQWLERTSAELVVPPQDPPPGGGGGGGGGQPPQCPDIPNRWHGGATGLLYKIPSTPSPWPPTKYKACTTGSATGPRRTCRRD